MNKIQSRIVNKGLASLLVMLSLCAALMMSGTTRNGFAATASSLRADKIALDLRQKVAVAAPGERVTVLVQPSGAWTNAIDNLLNQYGATNKRSYTNFKSRAMSLPATAIQALANLADVGYVSLDRDVALMGHITLTTGTDAARAMGGTSLLDGTGVGIAVLDSGIDPRHVAFDDSSSKSRIVVNVDFTGEGRTDDPYGHGTHVASIAAGNGNVSHAAYEGIASNAWLINLRVLNQQGKGSVSSLLSALDWIMTNRSAYNIRVVNLSLGAAAVDSYRNDQLCIAARKLVDAGIVVVAAAGNEGKDASGTKVYGQIHSPGNEPSVITVGAANSYGTDTRGDDSVTTYSSRGPTRSYWVDAQGVKHYDDLIKPDMVAPGNRIIDAQAPGNVLVANNSSLDANVSSSDIREQMYLSGTSMSTPVVAGAAALLLQANPTLTPNLVKAILMYTAQPLSGANQFEQGAGEVNIEGAVRMAKAIRTDLTQNTAVGSPLLCSTCTAPVAQTTIAGFSFPWGGGLILDHTFATGTNLMTQYQGIYAQGVLLGSGVVESGSTMSCGVLLGSGVVLGDSIMLNLDTGAGASGITIGEGNAFLGCGVLLSNGVVLGDSVNGSFITDGVLTGDGVVLGDGVMLSDGVLISDVWVQANRAMIDGDTSGAYMQGVPDLPPSAPSNLVTKAISSTQIDLNWKDNANNENGFIVEQSTNGTTFTQIAKLGRDVAKYSVTNLAANTTYTFRVAAYETGLAPSYSVNVTGTTLAPPPAAPTSLLATVASSSQINLTWADNSTNEDGFKIEKSTDGVSYTLAGSVLAGVKNFSCTGLAANKKYYFRVYAYNKGGNSSNSNVATATTKK